jgi:hypothetical protein
LSLVKETLQSVDPILVALAERTAPPPSLSHALVTAHVTGGSHYVRRSPGERRTLPLLCGGGRRHFPPRRLVEDRQSDRWRFSRPLFASLHHPVMQTGLRAPLRPRWGWGPQLFAAGRRRAACSLRASDPTPRWAGEPRHPRAAETPRDSQTRASFRVTRGPEAAQGGGHSSRACGDRQHGPDEAACQCNVSFTRLN